MQDQLWSAVELGIEMEAFIASSIGKELVARARGYAAESLQLLKAVDPCDYQQIVKLQNKVWLGETFEQWLAELIRDGWQAEEIIQGEE